MRPGTKRAALTVTIGILLILAQFSFAPSALALLYGDWGSRPVFLDEDPPGVPGSNGRNIVSTQWAYSTNYFFKMDLAGAPANLSLFGFYFDKDQDSATGGSKFGLTGIDMYFAGPAYGPQTLYKWTDLPGDSDTFLPAGSVTRTVEGNVMEWRIGPQNFSGNFQWWAATTNSLGQMKDLTASVTTPIPNAAWLLGSGILALIGLRRRHSKA
jgi:hypothetical protein